MAAFTPGNIVVYRSGDGTAALSTSAAKVFLDEYTPSGSLIQSIELPSTGAARLVTAGSSDSEGMINLTVDGQWLLVPGYNAAPGATNPATAAAAAAPRVIGRIGADGTIDLSTVLTDISTANRSPASINGTAIYDATSTGMRLATGGSAAASTPIVASGAERVAGIYDGQLYVSTATAINLVGTGLPSGTVTTTPIAFASNAPTSAYGFYFADLSSSVTGVDTLYVADDNLGLLKYSLVGTSWTYNGVVGTSADDYRGLTGATGGGTVTLYAARDNGGGLDTLVRIVDTAGYNGALTASATLVATGIANTEFRGVAFVPQAATAQTISFDGVTTDVTQNEGTGTGSAYSYTLTRTGSTTAAASVGYAISAAAGTTSLDAGDFVGGLNGTATFAAGSSTATLTITATGDGVIEPSEGFTVTLTAPSAGYTLGATNTAVTGTLTNDDGTIIPGGSFATTYTASPTGAYGLVAGTTRTVTANVVGVTVSSNATTIDIEGTLQGFQGARAIDGSSTATGDTVMVGASGLVTVANGDAIRFRAAGGSYTIANQGQVVVTNANAAPTVGGTNIGNAHGVVLTAVQGATGAPASDFTSGGTITNGSPGNTAALIRSSAGDAVRLGSHQTLVNYGTIDGNGPVNDASTNNVYRATGSNNTATTYGASRGVRIDDDGTANSNQGKSDRIENYGTIAGAQHGIDFGDPDAANAVVVNQAGGLIVGRNGSGIGADTIGVAASTITVTNSGIVRGERAATVTDRAGYTYSNAAGSTNPGDSDGDGVDIDGGATITNNAGASILGSGASGFDSNGRANASEGVSIGGGIIANAGIIAGADAGIVVNNDANADGSRSGGTATTITNYAAGTITGQASYAIRLENKTGSAADNDAIVNYGTITGNGAVPGGSVTRQDGNADAGTVGTLDGVTYTAADAGNARFIRGDGAAIQTGEGADTLANYGTITGNSGRAINLEGGSDTLTLYTGSNVAGRIDGGAGNDMLVVRLDDRPVSGGGAEGNNGGVVAGSLGNIVNFETLTVASGAWTITDGQSYSAGTTIAAGASLTLAAGGGLAGSIVDNGRLVANGAATFTLNGAISGAGTVEIVGGATLILAGAGGSYSGGTALTSGILNVAAAGAAGTGAITFASGAQTLIVDSAAISGGVFGTTISGFATDGDTIDVRGIGTASAAYNATTGVLTLAGSSTASLTIGTGYNNVVFNTAADGAGGTAVTIAPATPAVLSIGDAMVVEGAGGTASLVFTVTASAPAPGGGISFTATTADGTATVADGDYATLGSTYTIAPGQTSTTVTVAVAGDARIEADETLSVTLSNPANATLGRATATGTIVNDDFPTLSIGDPSVVEGGAGGTAVLRYTVTASAPAPAGGISFDIATADGTATAGSDYVARTVTGATIAAGQTSYVFDVQITGDTVPERAETVLVNLSNAARASIADAQGVGIIDNDDGAPAGLQDYFSTSFTGFTAAGFAPTPTTAQLDSDIWRVVGLSDNANPAFGGTYTTGDFARGVISGTADPATAGVYSPSANAALIVQPTGAELENGGFIEAQLVNATGFTATSFAIEFDWAFRNNAGRADNLALSYSTDGVSYTLVPAAAFSTPGDAVAGATFQLQHQSVTIGNVLVGDGNPLFLRWIHTGSTGGGSRDEVGIDNVSVRATVSDVQTVSAADISVTEGTGGTSTATFTLIRSSGTGSASIGYATADGTAIAGRDYTAQSGTVTFAEGERTKTVTVALNPDSANETSETFFLNLSNAVGVTLTDPQARATIVNDDTGLVAIYDIQGAGHASPFAGQSIMTGGIVTAINANSFWIQDPFGDGLFATSDAVQVFIGAAPTGVAVGDRVTVGAVVSEFTPTTGALTVTELTAPTITVLDHGNALPGVVTIGVDGVLPPTNVIDDDRLTSFDPQSDGIDFYEALEGMLVTVQTPIVTAPSSGRTTYVVASQGMGATNVNARGGITLTGDDAAPERIQIFADSTLLPGYTPNHTLGDVLGDVTGILTYYSFPELLPTQAITVVRDATTTQELTTLRGDADHLQIASFNIENADPGDPQAKFDAIGVEVVAALGTPDIIGLQEVQDADGAGGGANLSGQATAQKVIDAIVAAGGPTYSYVEVAPTTANTSGGEPGGNIRNGYLYNAARVGYVDGSAVLIQDAAYNNTRKPLVAQFTFNDKVVTVIDQHSTSRGGSDLSFGANQPPAQAGDAARTAQAAAIKAYIDNLQAADADVRVVTLGDFNGYYYETALSTLTNDGKLTNLYTLLPVEERYSYLFEGAVQAFDNIIVTNNLLPSAQFDVVHYNSEQSVQPITDHDQAVASLYIPRANTAPSDLAIDNASVAENSAAGTLVGTVTGVDAQGGTLSYTLLDDAGGRFAIDAATGRLTTTQPLDYEAAASATVAVQVSDGGGLTYSETIAIAVTDVNEAPTALTLSGGSVAENAPAGTVVGMLTGSDPDAGSTLRYTLVDSAGGRFAVDAATGQITTTSPLDYETLQSATLTARVTDQGGLTLDRPFTIAVTNVNEAPTALTLTGATIAENAPAGTLVGTATATDPDGDALRYSLVGNAGAFAIDPTTGRLTTTAPLDYEAASAAMVTVRADGQRRPDGRQRG